MARDPNSPTSRLLAFFEANPDEELTFDDAIAKLGIGRKHVYAVVKALTEKRLLESVHVLRLPAKGRMGGA